MISRTTLPADGGLRENETPYDIIHRFEKMPTKVYPSEGEAVVAIADKIVAAINDFTYSGGVEDKTFVLGIQFHPEIAVVRELDDTSLCYFTAIVEAAQ